jgi:hypothetical protein
METSELRVNWIQRAHPHLAELPQLFFFNLRHLPLGFQIREAALELSVGGVERRRRRRRAGSRVSRPGAVLRLLRVGLAFVTT